MFLARKKYKGYLPPRFSSVQDAIYPLRKAHMRSTSSLRSFPNDAFEMVPLFIRLTMALSHPFKEDCLMLPLSTRLSSRQLMVWKHPGAATEEATTTTTKRDLPCRAAPAAVQRWLSGVVPQTTSPRDTPSARLQIPAATPRSSGAAGGVPPSYCSFPPPPPAVCVFPETPGGTVVTQRHAPMESNLIKATRTSNVTVSSNKCVNLVPKWTISCYLTHS